MSGRWRPRSAARRSRHISVAAGGDPETADELPVLVFAATGEELARARTRALTRDMRTAIYTEEMFKTGNDDDNRAVVREAAELRLAGLAVHGGRNDVDKVLKGLPLHP
ncbi:DUF2000 family protein [Microtetraspora malaysiensis]|uniref:DUF2000 family protein n=1 Tax=Microtetraspora malaysiensis TaxID=161358 RepID=UPI003D900081